MSEHPTSSYKGPERVFSGVQPTGNLHLGNYLGAIRKFVTLQQSHDCLFCVVDMHAITVWQDPARLRAQTLEIAAAYLAAGIDPEKSIIFNQSHVSAHAELAWIFNCVARMGWLNRMTQFKDKAGKDKERASAGLFVYPNLMSADILAYKATHVPVGDDQKQHLELARDTAAKFNNDFGCPDFFPLPEPLIKGAGARVMSLKDGTAKMSKSDPADNSRINMTDDADMIARKIKKAKTDPEPLPGDVEGLTGRPEADNLVGIYAALAGVEKEHVIADFGGQGFGVFKPALADLAVEKLSPITARMREIQGDEAHLEKVLKDGAGRADAIAAPIMREVKEIVGFLV
ncbi:tryptophan--tRNA ligase [Aquisalinus flavus]|uniref:Tryptophan--tRNA ligase n=1 Tax=Aquisalinus flavus TaxID=1526572 RepID=A0A8J2V2J7_9PROT|nr:tryptophan--tRNA ligase [Aquisalinus flavus]MBD0426088.1 tryptophan--tRNA ligase [Aquisalinus flavus]UNE48327.1 tryptophan--tRNA ligase [Aquisalinus flavus]GGD10743.1 tryptophan--tRNA ligase [Aquisalinus flavus]